MRRMLQALCVLTVGYGLCLGSSFCVHAAESQPSAKATDPGVLFDRLDTDHKGVLSASQIPADKRSLFERLLRLAGKPADGELTRDEFVAQLKSITEPPASVPSSASGASNAADNSSSPKKSAESNSKNPQANSGRPQFDPDRLFDRWDKNHTGKLTVTDVPQRGQKLFERLLRISNKPADGSLTKPQFVKAANEVFAKRFGQSASTNGQSSTTPNRTAAAPGQAFDVDTLVTRLMQRSSRSDGQLTKSDLPDRLQNRFDKIDTNHDGFVSEAELRAFLEKRMNAIKKASGTSGAESNGGSPRGSGAGTNVTSP
jgi:Ca2+-binding EF-hand superfamily protein